MEIVYDLLVVTHLVGMAAIVGGWMAAYRRPRILTPMVWGARAQLLTGIVLVGLAESGVVDVELDRTKVAVKLLVALVVVALAERGHRRSSTSTGVFQAVGGLALLNVLVAVLW